MSGVSGGGWGEAIEAMQSGMSHTHEFYCFIVSEPETSGPKYHGATGQ